MIPDARCPAVIWIDIDDELIELIYHFFTGISSGNPKLESFAFCGLSIKVTQIRNRTRSPGKPPG